MASRNRIVPIVLAALFGIAIVLGIAHFWNRHLIEKLAREKDGEIQKIEQASEERGRQLEEMPQADRKQDGRLPDPHQLNQQNDRQIAELIVNEIVQKIHWPALETSEAFKQDVVMKLARKLGTRDAPDGTITMVDDRAGAVTIDQGLADGVKAGATFEVFDKSTDAKADEVGERKGMIEVTKSVAPHRAEAKITQQNEQNPIASGDLAISTEFRYRWRAIRPEANRRDEKGRPKNAFEEELLMRFARPTVGKLGSEDNESQPFADRIDPARQEYHYYKPIYLSADCVVCHRIHSGNTMLTEGDLLSLIQIRLPRKP